ncbi:MAG: hypothetical protein SGILL_009798, partial [Bacillariaceae sp.]
MTPVENPTTHEFSGGETIMWLDGEENEKKSCWNGCKALVLENRRETKRQIFIQPIVDSNGRSIRNAVTLQWEKKNCEIAYKIAKNRSDPAAKLFAGDDIWCKIFSFVVDAATGNNHGSYECIDVIRAHATLRSVSRTWKRTSDSAMHKWDGLLNLTLDFYGLFGA